MSDNTEASGKEDTLRAGLDQVDVAFGVAVTPDGLYSLSITSGVLRMDLSPDDPDHIRSVMKDWIGKIDEAEKKYKEYKDAMSSLQAMMLQNPNLLPE